MLKSSWFLLIAAVGLHQLGFAGSSFESCEHLLAKEVRAKFLEAEFSVEKNAADLNSLRIKDLELVAAQTSHESERNAILAVLERLRQKIVEIRKTARFGHPLVLSCDVRI